MTRTYPYPIKRISVITGHYGCGKSNFAAHFALYIKKELGRDCTLVDLDIVNPYFRTADLRDMLEEQGVKVVAPTFANTNLDIPVLTAEIQGEFEQRDHAVVIDVGGDDAGAIALGRYARRIAQDEDYILYYLVNRFRYFERELGEDPLALLRDIEAVSRLRASYLVDCSNLAGATTADDLLVGAEAVNRLSAECGLPVAYHVALRSLCPGLEGQIPDLFPCDRLIMAPWEDKDPQNS